MQTLAVVSDAAAISMWVVQIATSVILTVALFRIGAGQRRMERSEDARNVAMKDLADKVAAKDGELHVLAEKLVDQKFRAMTHSINNHVEGFARALDEAKARLKDTEVDLEKIVEESHKNELSARDKLEQVKDYVRDHAASKADVREHQRHVNEMFGKLDQKLDRIAAQQQGAKRNA